MKRRESTGQKYLVTLCQHHLAASQCNVIFVLILTIIKTFQVFDIVKVLTRGGPEKASEILLYTMYQEGFSFFRMGTAAAVAAIYLAVMLLLTWANNAVIGRRVHYGFE